MNAENHSLLLQIEQYPRTEQQLLHVRVHKVNFYIFITGILL